MLKESPLKDCVIFDWHILYLHLKNRLPLMHSIQEIREFRLYRSDDYTFHNVPVMKVLEVNSLSLKRHERKVKH